MTMGDDDCWMGIAFRYTCTPSGGGVCDDDDAVIIVVIVAVLLLGGIGLSVGIYCCCKQQKSQPVNVQVNAAVQAKQVAVAPTGPTVAAAPAQVVAPAFDPPLAGGGQFCASCGQVPTPCLVLQDFVRLLLALAYAYQRDARAAKTAGGQVLRGAAAANTRSFALLASRTARRPPPRRAHRN